MAHPVQKEVLMGGTPLAFRHRHGQPGPNRYRGVTLPEILIVLAIMGLFILVAIPAVNNYIRASKVRTSNDVLLEDLRAARYVAITNRISSAVTIDQSAKTWQYTDIHGRSITRALESGVSFSSVTGSPVTFQSDGSASTAATIVIQGTVSTLTHQFTISVTTVGRVSSVFTRF